MAARGGNPFTGRVLALDLATTTGWAYGVPETKPEFGWLQFAKPGADRPVIYRAFRNWLEETWNERDAQPDLIVYESPAVPSMMAGKTNIDTTKLLIGLAEHLEEWCYGRVELREARWRRCGHTSSARISRRRRQTNDCGKVSRARLERHHDRRSGRLRAMGLPVLLARPESRVPVDAVVSGEVVCPEQMRTSLAGCDSRCRSPLFSTGCPHWSTGGGERKRLPRRS